MLVCTAFVACRAEVLFLVDSVIIQERTKIILADTSQ
jgi:hypothetical protein